MLFSVTYYRFKLNLIFGWGFLHKSPRFGMRGDNVHKTRISHITTHQEQNRPFYTFVSFPVYVSG